MTDLTDKLADALEEILGRCPDCGGSGVRVGWRGNPPEMESEQCQWCDAGITALQAYRAQRDGERETWLKIPDNGSEQFKSGDQYELQGKWLGVPCSWIGTKAVKCDSYSGYRRPLAKGEAYPCPQCDGEGELKAGECHACKGTGKGEA